MSAVASFMALMTQNILDYANLTADPCSDFYEFACGNYSNARPLADHESSIDIINNMAMDVRPKIQAFEKPISNDDPSSVKLAKTLFASCMDEESRDKDGIEPLKNVIKNIAEWPVLVGQTWNESQHDWLAVAVRTFVRHNHLSLFETNVAVDKNNNLRHAFYIDIPDFGMANLVHYLEENSEEEREDYRVFLKEIALQQGANESVADQDAADVVKFETQLVNISLSSYNGEDFANFSQPTTLGALIKTYPQLPLGKFFELVQNESGIALEDDLRIVVKNPVYMTNLASVINTASKRELICAIQVELTFPDTTSYMYIQEHYRNVDYVAVTEIVDSIKIKLSDEITNNRWMDNATKEEAKEKLRFMGANVGYPEYINNETRRLAGFPADMSFNTSAFFANYLDIEQKLFSIKMNKWKQLTETSEWEVSASSGNAVATLARNYITLPATILKDPLFSNQAPGYYNYGRIGFIIGHEITHHFDNNGRQYGKTGLPEQWWSNQSADAFAVKEQCFVDQYNSLVEPLTNRSINGEVTIGENLSDNGAIRIAFEAYVTWLENNASKEPAPIGELNNYNNKQLFFINFAQVFCNNYNAKAMLQHITQFPHTPGRFRVNVPLQNYEQFATVFNCSSDSAMNPSQRCRLW